MNAQQASRRDDRNNRDGPRAEQGGDDELARPVLERLAVRKRHFKKKTVREYRGVPGSSGEFRGVPGSTGEFRGVPGSSGEFRGVPGRSGEFRGTRKKRKRKEKKEKCLKHDLTLPAK